MTEENKISVDEILRLYEDNHEVLNEWSWNRLGLLSIDVKFRLMIEEDLNEARRLSSFLEEVNSKTS